MRTATGSSGSNRQARGDLSVQRVADADPLELTLHVSDILEGPASGCMPPLIAAFSAGNPKASHPNGCSTLKPRMRFMRATTSPIM